MSTLPEGVLTFLFTDIEGSTRLWELYPEAMRRAHARHQALVTQAVEARGGSIVRARGEGDSTFCVFRDPAAAVRAACAMQRDLHREPWPERATIRVRAALHQGEAHLSFGDYNSSAVNRCARIRSLASGGQTLLSEAVYLQVREGLGEGLSFLALGSHRLRDLTRPEPLYQLLHPELPSEFPALRSLDTLPTNLPRQLTSFIGREREMEDVRGLLGRARLLTIVGAGGAGKTRLALQSGAEMLEEMADGVWLVELAALSDAALVAQSLAAALGLREEAGRAILETLQEFLRSRRLLVLLDNCEHLLGACAELAESLLGGCPQLRILATSREPLNVPGEQVWRIPSLALPAASAELTPEALGGYESARLFVERCQQVRSGFALTATNAGAVATLCRRLDGIPLAIELAAARVRALSPEQIARRLDDRFRLLSGGSRTALPRQQTLRALIEWSWDLLSASEKRLLARLSVFAGGWDLEAAEGVCADRAGDAAEGGDSRPMMGGAEVVDLLGSLVDKSLVLYDESVERYRMLETVGQYASERLAESGEEARWRSRHLEHFVSVALDLSRRLDGSEQQRALGRLDTENGNLRAALSLPLQAPGDTMDRLDLALRLCAALWPFWAMHGYASEGRARLAEVLALEPHRQAPEPRARALLAAGALAYQQSDFGLARKVGVECLTIARSIGNRRLTASQLGNLGMLAYTEGRVEEAYDLYAEALAMFRELGDRLHEAVAVVNMGRVAHDRMDYPAARAAFEESLAIFREQGNRWRMAESITSLGAVAIDLGELETARSLYTDALGIGRDLGERRLIAHAQLGLANTESRRAGSRAARPLFAECLTVLHEIRDLRTTIDALEGLAAAEEDERGSPLAARLLGAAERLREQIGVPLAPNELSRYEQAVRHARAGVVDDAAFECAWREGRGMTLDEAVALALEAPEA